MSRSNITYLTIVTENQSLKVKAERLAQLLQVEFGEICSLKKIEKYSKFDNSYKIELEFSFAANENLILSGISLTDKIASPWTIYFDRGENTVELIFNKNSHTQFRKIEFNVIIWGHYILS